MLSSRDRVAAALRGEEADRVPYCEVYLSRAFAHPLMGWPGDLDHHASFEANEFSLDEAKAVAERLQMDNITYVLRAPIYADKTEGKGGTLFYGAGYIHSEADLAQVQLPDPYNDALYAEAEAYAANKGPYSAWFITRVGISPTMMSMGIEDFSLALYDDRRLVERLLDMYVDWVEVVAERICALDFDVFVTTDDIAFGQGLFFSPQVFRELVYPRFERLARKITIPWLFHSDGNVTATPRRLRRARDPRDPAGRAGGDGHPRGQASLRRQAVPLRQRRHGPAHAGDARGGRRDRPRPHPRHRARRRLHRHERQQPRPLRPAGERGRDVGGGPPVRDVPDRDPARGSSH